tara:strand:- start:255 stop:824 length:570 start_codon:yes stop_codon:yes gene_type:complete
MILPIVAFGSPVLREKCLDVSPNDVDLDVLISDMWETMYQANGVGLAAPQINRPIRLFLIDTTPFFEDQETNTENTEQIVKKVFINAKVLEEEGDSWEFNEGCLSIPEIRENVSRKSCITIEYMDENFTKFRETYSGLTARVIQHEYDHIQGILFVDRISMLRKKMIKGKLRDISNGKVGVDYKMRFYK